MNILHLCSKTDWDDALEQGIYRAESLETEGFIHCSKPEQIIAVANRYFSGQKGLCLLWIDGDKLRAELRFEPSDGDIFPHLYGPLNLDAVYAVSEFLPDSDGVFKILPNPGN
jgi:uncharacterized protein (DUF952 family)